MAVIDGQQRLTTLSVLLRACYDTIPFEQYDDQEMKTGAMTNLKSVLFYNTRALSSEYIIKIKHSMVDALSFEQVVNGKVNCEQVCLQSEASKNRKASSGILQCYKYFRLRLAENPQNAEAIWNTLLDERINILVKIDLDSDENEQKIFDTENTAGVRLTCSDTIKNALFQKAIESDDHIFKSRR